MNNILSEVIDKHSPKVNKNVTEGTAKEVLQKAPYFLDDIIRSSIKSLSQSIKLSYNGWRYITPKEEFKLNYSNGNSGKVMYDLARNDLYMVEFEFEYQGIAIKRPIYLPYADDGNLLMFSNTLYNIVPVLSDTVITPSSNEVFARLLKDKVRFKNHTRNFIVNGERKPGLIIYADLVKTANMNLKDNIGKPIAPVSLYLLGEYGADEVMKRYYKINKSDYMITNQELTEQELERFNVYESTKTKPRYLKEVGYRGHNIKVCISKDKEINQSLENLIFGIIYTFDQLPTHEQDYVDTIKLGNLEDEKMFWRIMLGRLVYKNTYSVDRIVSDMDEHFDTLQGYLDNLIKKKLVENGIHLSNFFDLINHILLNYNHWLVISKEYNSDIRNRYIDILYYIMYDIILGFNRAILSLNKRATKTKGKDFDITFVSKVLKQELNSKKIFTLVKSKEQGLAIMVVDNTLDVKYPRITAVLED